MHSYLNVDQLLKVTRALPASASASVNSSGIDLLHGPQGQFLADCEVEVQAPAVNTTMAPDTRTFTYKIEHDDDAAFGTVADLMPAFIVQTGAGGAGAAAANKRFRLPSNVKRYIRLTITSGASTADASAVSATLQLLFG